MLAGTIFVGSETKQEMCPEKKIIHLLAPITPAHHTTLAHTVLIYVKQTCVKEGK